MQSKEIVDFLRKAKRTGDMVGILPDSTISKDIIKYLEELERYKIAEQQGLLVKLPCKIGDAIYRMTPETLVPITRDIIMQITICDGFILLHGEVISEIDAAEIGETAFLSMEEADRKLKELTE
jgi:hypothetical protein